MRVNLLNEHSQKLWEEFNEGYEKDWTPELSIASFTYSVALDGSGCFSLSSRINSILNLDMKFHFTVQGATDYVEADVSLRLASGDVRDILQIRRVQKAKEAGDKVSRYLGNLFGVTS